MYNLTIHFGPNAVAWSFLFKDKEQAEAAFCTLSAPCPDDRNPSGYRVKIEDSFSQTATIVLGATHGVLLEDLDAGEEARIIRGLSQAKGQMRANKRAQSDPEIKALQREQQGGPSVLTPFTNGGFRPQ